MHEHDMDLIMALAEGSLGESEAAAARRQLASCAQCLEDLALHEAALETLRHAPRAYLTALESAALRSRVKQQLGLADAAATPRKARRLPFGALAGAAAVLLAVVVAGPALDLLGSSGDADAPTDVAAAPAAPEIDETTGDAPAEAALPAAPDSADATGQQEELSTAIPPAAEPAPARAGLPRFDPSLDLTELKAAIVSAGVDAAVTRFSDDVEALAAPSAPEDVSTPSAGTDGGAPIESAGALAGCDPESVGGGAGSEAAILGLVQVQSGGDGLVMAFIAEPIEDTLVVVVDVATCEVLETS